MFSAAETTRIIGENETYAEAHPTTVNRWAKSQLRIILSRTFVFNLF